MKLKNVLNKGDTLNLPPFRIDTAFSTELSIFEFGSFSNIDTQSALYYCDRDRIDDEGFIHNDKLDAVLEKAQELFGHLIPMLREHIYYVHMKTEYDLQMIHRSKNRNIHIKGEQIKGFDKNCCSLAFYNNEGKPGGRLVMTSKEGNALDMYTWEGRIVYCVVITSDSQEYIFNTKNPNADDLMLSFLGNTIVEKIVALRDVSESILSSEEDFQFWGTPIKVEIGNYSKSNTLTIYSV